MSLTIAPLQAHERSAWQLLARGYMDFYKTEKAAEDYDTACIGCQREADGLVKRDRASVVLGRDEGFDFEAVEVHGSVVAFRFKGLRIGDLPPILPLRHAAPGQGVGTPLPAR